MLSLSDNISLVSSNHNLWVLLFIILTILFFWVLPIYLLVLGNQMTSSTKALANLESKLEALDTRENELYHDLYDLVEVVQVNDDTIHRALDVDHINQRISTTANSDSIRDILIEL